jgi:hypothetical protein
MLTPLQMRFDDFKEVLQCNTPRVDKGKALRIRVGLLQHFDSYCQQGALSRIFSSLPSLRAIIATSGYCFEGCGLDLSEQWSVMTKEEDPSESGFENIQYQDRRTSVKRYTDILIAAGQNETPIPELTLDPFPIDAIMTENPGFASNDEEDAPDDEEDMHLDPDRTAALRGAVGRVRNLRIRILGTFMEYRNPILARTMGDFLGSMHHLRSLDLNDNMDRCSVLSFQTSFQDTLSKLKFPYLESLRLQRTELPLHQILQLLGNHKSTLKRLCLGHHAVSFDEGLDSLATPPSWQNPSDRKLLTRIRDEMALQQFEYIPWELDEFVNTYASISTQDWVSLVDTARQTYCSHEEALQSNDDRDDLDSARRLMLEMQVTKLLELFVLGKSRWPMNGDVAYSRSKSRRLWYCLSGNEQNAGFDGVSVADAAFLEKCQELAESY